MIRGKTIFLLSNSFFKWLVETILLLLIASVQYLFAQGYLRNDNMTTYTSGITINEISARSAITDFNCDGSVNSATDKDEYIEIINNFSSNINIGGWILGDNTTSYTFASNTIIKAGHGLVVFTREADVSNFNPGTDNLVLSPTGATILALANTNDAIGLRNTDNLYIEVKWGTGTVDASISSGASLVGTSITLSSWTEGIAQTRNSDFTGNWSDSPTINGTVNWSLDSPTITLTDPQGSPDRFVNGNPLPVELSYFLASNAQEGIKLKWRTETEVNNYGFEIERQVGSKQTSKCNWNKIGFVEGNGNSNSPKLYSFIDRNISGGRYSYRLKQIDNDGTITYSNVVSIDANSLSHYELNQNYPNPFNPTTKIKFTLPEAAQMSVKVFNVLGKEVAELVNKRMEAGTHEVNFDATGLNSGIYFYRIKAGYFISVKKMTLLR